MNTDSPSFDLLPSTCPPNLLGAHETLEFVRSFAPSGATILDAGCGNALLARVLIDAGYSITAIDDNENAIAEAKANSVEAIRCNFLEYDASQSFDVVLFSRSLHHINPLQSAVEKAHASLKRGGVVLVEDFGGELLDAKTAVWFYGLKAVIESQNGPSRGRGPKLENGRAPDDPLSSWRDHHFGKHQLTESGAMLPALRNKFESEHEAWLPYLYRYFLDDVSRETAARLLEWERALIQAQAIVATGFRFAGRKS